MIFYSVDFVYLIWVLRPTHEFFTGIEMSPLLVKGSKILHILGTYGHLAVRLLKHATPTVTHGILLYGHL